jgi:hypothetical protein
MTRRSRRPGTALATVVTVMMLAAASVAYAHWTATLDVHGHVETGGLQIGWTGAICSEFHDWPWPPEEFGEFDGLDIASTSVEIPDPSLLQITVENGYPSYSVDCEIELTNFGSIPVVIRGWRFTPLDNLENCETQYFGTGSGSLECDEISVVLVDGVGTQIDPGDPYGMASSLRFHIENPAEQSTTFRWQLEVCASNWNEPVSAEQCFAPSSG